MKRRNLTIFLMCMIIMFCSLTVGIYASLDANFNATGTIEYVGVQMPTKGDLITMDLVEGTETVKGLADTYADPYRVLNIDGNVAEVVAMYDLNSGSQKYHNSTNHTITGTNGQKVQQYSGSDLDTYLNTTWYNTLSANAKAAIVANNITQYSYHSNESVYNETTHASYANYSSKAKVADLTKKVYALDVEDIEAYFGGTKGQNGKTAGTFSNADIWELFWDTTTKPSTVTYPWLRSARTGNPSNAWYVYGSSGNVYYNRVSNNYAARAAFKIDLSKIDFTIKQ